MSEENQAQNLINIESLITSISSRINDLSYDLKEQKSMIDEILESSQEYKGVEQEAKKQAKLKTLARQKTLNDPGAKSSIEKIKDIQIQLREAKTALSDYLSQYITLSGSNQIEGPDGVVRKIIYTAKLVKSK